MPGSEKWATWRMAVSIPEKECVRNRFATQIWVFQHDLLDVTPLSRKANGTHHRYLQQEGFSSPLSQYGWLRSASNKSTGFVQIKNQFQIFIVSTVCTSMDFFLILSQHWENMRKAHRPNVFTGNTNGNTMDWCFTMPEKNSHQSIERPLSLQVLWPVPSFVRLHLLLFSKKPVDVLDMDYGCSDLSKRLEQPGTPWTMYQQSW